MRILFRGAGFWGLDLRVAILLFFPGGLRGMIPHVCAGQRHRADDDGAAARFFLDGHGAANHPLSKLLEGNEKP